jgi:hypothetical protein
MLHPNSVRQRFIQPRLFMVYMKKKRQNHDTADEEVSSLKRKHPTKEMCLSPHDGLTDRNLVLTATHSCSLGTV